MSNPGQILPYAPPPIPINTPADILRRATLWTILCSVSAAPSFMWATHEYSTAAMIAGISLFILLYTILTSTPAFLRFRDQPFVRRTLYIGYGTRVALSVVFPIGLIFDLFPGLLSIGIVQGLAHTLGLSSLEPQTFGGTFLITLCQGTIINVILSIYMLVIWALQRAMFPLPREARGFPVEPARSN